MSRLRRFRELRGLQPQELARSLSISTPAYYDLESDGDDLTTTISVGQVRALCRLLDISPSVLLGPDTSVMAASREFAEKVAAHLQKNGQSAKDFSSAIGWDVEPLLRAPHEVGRLNAEGFKAVCDAVGLNWLSILDQIQFSSPS